MPEDPYELLDRVFPPGAPLGRPVQRISIGQDVTHADVQQAMTHPLRPRLVVDFETASEVDLDVVGAYRYAIDPSTRILCVSMRYQDSLATGPVGDRLVAWGEHLERAHLSRWFNSVASGALIQAYNSTFDYLIWKHIADPRHHWPNADHWEWECLMQRAAYGNLPGGLGGVAQVLGTPRKDPVGHRLMMSMAKPARAIRADSNAWRLHTDENLQRLALYCQQDVEAEEPLDRLLPKLPACEVPVVKADRKMNERGIRVDLSRVAEIQAVALDYSQHLNEDLNRITRGQVTAATQLPAMRSWLIANRVPLRDGPGALDRYAIDGFLDGENYDGSPLAQPLTPEVMRVLQIRRWLGKSSLAKLKALQAATSPVDGRVRGMFQYYGADRTGRWAGRIIQPQNLPKGVLSGQKAYNEALWAISEGLPAVELLYGDTLMDVLASCLRTCLIPSVCHQFMVIDYNAIECRVAAWFANERWLLECFATGRDPYRYMAGWVLRKEPDQVTKPERNDSGKLPELSCQYGLGWRSFKKQAKQRGLVFTDEWSQYVVRTYREKHPAIKAMWYALEDAAHRATRDAGTIHEAGKVRFKHDGAHLRMRLPAGRCITFWKARIEMRPVPWDPEQLKPVLVYWGEDSVTKQWSEQTAWGGDFMAISCQGIARDIIADALVRTEMQGDLNPVLTVHDELGFDTAREDYENVVDFMCDLPAWCTGLPMKAEGFVSPFYCK